MKNELKLLLETIIGNCYIFSIQNLPFTSAISCIWFVYDPISKLKKMVHYFLVLYSNW